MNKRVASFLINEKDSIKKAMKYIDKSGWEIGLIVNKNKKLIGVATDGDIRRALLSGKNLKTPIKSIMKTDPIVASKKISPVELLEMMIEKGIHQIPIIDKNNTIVDIVLLSDLKNIPLSSPDITHKEVKIINQVLSTPFLSIGPHVKTFEEKVANYIGTKHAISVNSGTSGLHLCIRSLNIKDNDEVITTPFSFIASANCILFERAKPVFVDIDENTLCIDPAKIEEKITKKTKAILPVHIFGHPCQMDKIMKIAKKHHLLVIEDACEAIGTEFDKKKVGSLGTVSVFAFYPNKQITTAEGGMILTNDKKIANLCQSMRNQGRDEKGNWLSFKRLGYNYRMNELSAALGVAQIDRIEEILIKRQRVADLYNKRLKIINGIRIPFSDSRVKMSWFVYVIRLDSYRFSRKDRDKIIQRLKKKGINCKDYFSPIHLQPFYRKMFGYKRGDFPITEKVSDYTIALPFYNNLTEKEINYICSHLERVINEF